MKTAKMRDDNILVTFGRGAVSFEDPYFFSWLKENK